MIEPSWTVWTAPVLAFVLGGAVLRLLLSERLRGFVLDTPNERSLHSTPIPRTGGIALLMGAMVGAWVCPSVLPALALALALGLISLFDDRFGLPVLLRFAAHVLAATLAVHWAAPEETGAVAVVALLGITWMTNLFNFMDGSDGLAGGMAIAGFGAYAWAAGWAGHGDWAVALTCVSGASLAFLVGNWPPARVFMGDVGSIPLGFLAAAVAVWGYARQWWPVWFPPMVFAPFVVDATFTLLRRGARGEKVWQAHREHSYQRLVLAGWSKRKLMIWAHALMLVCGAWALLSLQLSGTDQLVSLMLFVIVLLILVLAIERKCAPLSSRKQH